jgi:hypothetical protein
MKNTLLFYLRKMRFPFPIKSASNRICPFPGAGIIPGKAENLAFEDGIISERICKRIWDRSISDRRMGGKSAETNERLSHIARSNPRQREIVHFGNVSVQLT